MKDRQAERLYRWEESWRDWNRQTQTLVDARKFVRTACAKYSVKPPTVVSHRHTELPFYMPVVARISFNKKYRNPAIALHEAVHHIIYVLLGETVEDHGREFVGVYLWLLDNAGIAPRIALEASARAVGLRWVSIDDSAPMRFLRRVNPRRP